MSLNLCFHSTASVLWHHVAFCVPPPLCFLVIHSADVSVPTILQFIVSISSNSMSTIPNNTGPFPGATKNLQALCAIVTLHMAIPGIVVPSCIFNMMLFYLKLLAILLIFEESILNLLFEISLSSLPLSTWYGMIVLYWLLHIFNCCYYNQSNVTEIKRSGIHHTNMFVSLCFLFYFMGCFLSWFCTHRIFPYSEHCLSIWLELQYLHLCICLEGDC